MTGVRTTYVFTIKLKTELAEGEVIFITFPDQIDLEAAERSNSCIGVTRLDSDLTCSYSG